MTSSEIEEEREAWRQGLQERVDESLRRRAARAAVRQDLARRRRRGLESRLAEKLIRADLDAVFGKAPPSVSAPRPRT